MSQTSLSHSVHAESSASQQGFQNQPLEFDDRDWIEMESMHQAKVNDIEKDYGASILQGETPVERVPNHVYKAMATQKQKLGELHHTRAESLPST